MDEYNSRLLFIFLLSSLIDSYRCKNLNFNTLNNTIEIHKRFEISSQNRDYFCLHAYKYYFYNPSNVIFFYRFSNTYLEF